MLFNSIDFAVFLPIVFVLYWFVTRHHLRLQNWLLVFASYLFYGWWDYRFLSLIFFSSMVDYLVGIGLSNQKDPFRRKLLLATSVVVNLGLLGFFKYYNFFLDNFVAAFTLFGSHLEASSLQIILPVGISFYTFQTMSYSLDVYRGSLKATRDFVSFNAFVSFFPQLVAGPIERASNLLPQFYTAREFNLGNAVNGCRQILWGFFKKVVIADNCATYANMIFNNSSDYSGSTLVLGAVFFAFQIYGDFSGYSDIAIGTARLFGFELMQNFNFPYFSRDIAEFWRRWHISLSTWFRDYLYIPLGGSRGSLGKKLRNTMIVFVVSGFWHGANWTFIVWGFLNALYFLPLLLSNTNRTNLDIIAKGRVLPPLREFLMMIGTFSLTLIAWIFFRANNVPHALDYLARIVSPSLFTLPHLPSMGHAMLVLALVVFFILVEWFGREQSYAIERFGTIKAPILRRATTIGIALLILLLGNFGENSFIYFQF